MCNNLLTTQLLCFRLKSHCIDSKKPSRLPSTLLLKKPSCASSAALLQESFPYSLRGRDEGEHLEKQTENPVRGRLGWYTASREYSSSLPWEWIGLEGNREHWGVGGGDALYCMTHENIMNRSQRPNRQQHTRHRHKPSAQTANRQINIHTHSAHTISYKVSVASVTLKNFFFSESINVWYYILVYIIYRYIYLFIFKTITVINCSSY